MERNAKMVSIFIDASCIADWILIKIALENSSRENKEKELREIEEINSDAYHAYSIIEKIKLNEIKNTKFYTSPLAISEVVVALFDRYICNQMHKKNIPLRYFNKYRNKMPIPEKISDEIYKELLSFHLHFIAPRKEKKKIEAIKESDLQISIQLICEFKADTHDSFLISQALTKNTKYFLTADNRLKDSLEKFNRIRIINPRTLYLELKRDKKLI